MKNLQNPVAPPSMEALKSALMESILPHVPASASKGGSRSSKEGSECGAGEPTLSDGQWRNIGREIGILHEGYTSGGTKFARDQNPIHSLMAGYQFYYLPRNLYRVYSVLRSLPWAGNPSREHLASLCLAGRSTANEGGAGRGGTGKSGAGKGGAGEEIVEGGEPAFRLLDLGCGSGAFTLAWLVWISHLYPAGKDAPPVEVTLVDQGRELLALATANIAAFVKRALPELQYTLHTRADGAARFLSGEGKSGGRNAPTGSTYSVAGAAMMLNELALLGPRRVSNRAARYGDALRRLTRGGGLLMFVEPGTRKGYMHLMTLRERMEGLPILYPCPHVLPCPFWRGKVRNWCHAEVPLPGGFFFDRILREKAGVDFAMREINMAALVVQNIRVQNSRVENPGVQNTRNQNPETGRVEAPFAPQKGQRVVSNPMPARTRGPKSQTAARNVQPGEIVVLVCGGDGRLHDRPARTLANLGKGVRGSWIDGAGRGD